MSPELSFGRWLRQRRRALDLTQEALAERVGCAAETIRRFEAERLRPSRALAEHLAEVLQLPVEERTTFITLARRVPRVAQPPRKQSPLAPAIIAPPEHGAGPTAAVSPPSNAEQPQRPDQPPPALPTGTVTLLFTDIEGSTQLLQRLGPRYGGLLTEYQQLLRATFHAAGGIEVDTQGDSCFIVFPRAIDAVGSAVAAQQALAAHPWREGTLLGVEFYI